MLELDIETQSNYWKTKRIQLALRNYNLVLNYKNLIGGFNMKYQNNCIKQHSSIKWSIAVYIKKHFNYRLGNALLNAIC